MNKKIIGIALLLGLSVITMDAMQQRRGIRGTGQRRTRTQQIPAAQQKHRQLKQQFLQLRRNLGLTDPSPAKTKIKKVRQSGQYTQADFNRIREELNNLLSKQLLTDADIKRLDQKINELQGMNPARYPRAEDYRELYRLRQ